MMVGSSRGKMIANSGKRPCGVGKEYRQTLFSVQYLKNGFTSGAVVCVVTCHG